MTPDRPLPWVIIAAFCLTTFAVTSAGATRSPFVLVMASDLEVSMPLVANLVSMTATAYGFASVLGGRLSDQIGRRPLLVAAPFALGLAMLLLAQSEGFVQVALWATVAGGCAGTFMAVAFAEVSALVGDAQRGRALSWVMSSQSMTLLVGLPLASWVGSIVGWRGWNVCVGVLAIVAGLSVLLTTRPTAKRETKPTAQRVGFRAALSPRVLALLGANVAERICYGLTAVYYAAFLQTAYGLPLVALALPLALFAAGNIAGNTLGGQLGDWSNDRLGIFALAMATAGAAALALFLWHPAPEISVGLVFLYALLNALGRPSLVAEIAVVPDEMRGTVMGLSSASASVGLIGAAGVGGLVVGWVGFEGFGPLAVAVALIGSASALYVRRMVAPHDPTHSRSRFEHHRK